jgi:spermidine/putrescine transport system permease protein
MKSRNLGLRLCAAATYAFLYAPIAVLILFSFNDTTEKDNFSPFRGFSLHWYEVAWNNKQMMDAMWVSLKLAALAAVIAVALAVPAAVALGRYSFTGKTAVETFFNLPLVVPEVVVGFGTAAFLRFVDIGLGFAALTAAHTAFGVSYAIMVIRARLAGMDDRLTEAAMDLGATPLQAFFKVTLPLLMPGIVSALLLVFTVSLDDYVISRFVAGTDSRTLPLEIYGLTRRAVTPQINAVSTVLLVISTGMAAAALMIQRAADRRTGELKGA